MSLLWGLSVPFSDREKRELGDHSTSAWPSQPQHPWLESADACWNWGMSAVFHNSSSTGLPGNKTSPTIKLTCLQELVALLSWWVRTFLRMPCWVWRPRRSLPSRNLVPEQRKISQNEWREHLREQVPDLGALTASLEQPGEFYRKHGIGWQGAVEGACL